MAYTQVSAGRAHTVLLRNDGRVVACGKNDSGQCNIPPLEEGVFYTQVSAGGSHTVLLQSDGRAAACGKGSAAQCDIPPLDPGLSLGSPVVTLHPFLVPGSLKEGCPY